VLTTAVKINHQPGSFDFLLHFLNHHLYSFATRFSSLQYLSS
jgi:hypothetical protein